MSLANLAHVCSHLNNVTKARLSITSIPNTNLHLRLCLAFQKAGLISGVVRGGPHPPEPHLLLNQPAMTGDEQSLEPVTQSNVSSRRLWVGLKYWQSEPVLGKVQLISKPKRRISLKVDELRKILRGERSGQVEGLRSPGECIFLSTDRGIMEARECIEKKTGGLALCRVR
ncbi:hypothetical protein VTN49DRAFT_6373 [Thermomyces lanuginosus]|uniref:mitochondrial 37S ribosomal protein uS8m n=1 Tax=Thermomyces lanuginosus TaxID=5541 RepID=UPI0037424F09